MARETYAHGATSTDHLCAGSAAPNFIDDLEGHEREAKYP